VLATEWLENGVEIYGESASKPLLSAAFELRPEESPDRAIALAAAELRIEDAPVPVPLGELLHSPARSYAAALSSACPRGTSPLNLLPMDAREIRSAWEWIPTAALAAAVLIAVVGLLVFPHYRNGRYLEALNAEIQKVQPQATQAAALDKQIQETRARTAMLDKVREQGKTDMDVLAAMTTLLAPPAWLRSMDIGETQIRVTGEAPQAAPLLKVIDESPLFEGSEFMSPPQRGRSGEIFSIRSKRTEARN
jgi:hypothetical protein